MKSQWFSFYKQISNLFFSYFQSQDIILYFNKCKNIYFMPYYV